MAEANILTKPELDETGEPNTATVNILMQLEHKETDERDGVAGPHAETSVDTDGACTFGRRTECEMHPTEDRHCEA